jgi:hypothetical protein
MQCYYNENTSSEVLQILADAGAFIWRAVVYLINKMNDIELYNRAEADVPT